MVKDNSTLRKLGKTFNDMQTLQVPWSGQQLRVPAADSEFGPLPPRISVYEAIESEKHRLENQESFLLHEARIRVYQHQQQVTDVQMHLDAASQQSQEHFLKSSVYIGRNGIIAQGD